MLLREEALTVQGFRSATGVLVLSTALLIGSAGGATAVADTGSGDSSSTSSSADSSGADSSGAEGSGAESSSSDSSPSVRDSNPTSHRRAGSTSSQDDDSTESLAADEDADEASVAEDVDEAAAAEDADEATVTEDADESPVAVEEPSVAGEGDAVPTPEHIEDESAAETLATVTEPDVAEAAAPEPVVSVSGSNGRDAGTVAALSTKPTLASDEPLTASSAVATPPNALTGYDISAGEFEPAALIDPAPFTTMFTTLETVVVSLGDAAAAIPPVIWALPFSETPISDVVALLETVLGSVTQSAAAVAQLPRNFVALLGVPTVSTYTAAPGEPSGHRLPATVDARVAAVIPAGAPTMLGMAPTQSADPVVASSGFLPALNPTALAALAAPIKSVPAPIPALAGEYETVFDRAFGALIVPLSLWALATGALPGLVGLLVVFGAGARVGYRQAKAGLALKVAGIARFAGPGPLGVVRSGSLIAVHRKGARAGSPRWSRLGDQAA